ncbi:MAG: hypothetical protein J6Q03_00075 [Paludibacteraceae bacterium]|nr:hypothetical protein [Paludibacteraceae bacterium]
MVQRFQYLACLLLLLVGLLPACQESSNPSSAIKGEHYFSVNANKKIIFSSGNLQHQPSTGSWRFADNQWDIFIPDNSNDSIGQWVGHFANDTSMLNNSVGDGWRLLTQDEWVYLRDIRENASKLISMATVQGKPGMVILPDNFDSTGIRFTPSVLNDDDKFHADMTNIYDAEEWKKMEEAGAVFFPCAGLAENIPDSRSIEFEETCYTKSIFGVVAQIPEIYKDSIETDKEEEWLYLDILFSPYTRRHFSRQINAENPSNIGYCGMGAGEYWISDKRSRDTTSFPIIHFYVENNEGRGTIESKTRYDGCDLLPVRLVKDAECSK